MVKYMSIITTEELDARLDYILDAPKDRGELKMIVIRPRKNERLVLKTCHLSLEKGAEGDNWAKGAGKTLPNGKLDPDVQLTVMNYRVLELLADSNEKRAMAGDNLCVDLDLSEDNLQHGDRLKIGASIVKITDFPHNGCRKFQARFGASALAYVISSKGKELHLRGIYARVVKDGVATVGDAIEIIKAEDSTCC
jgi:MOSC domain-containing protein YiiM